MRHSFEKYGSSNIFIYCQNFVLRISFPNLVLTLNLFDPVFESGVYKKPKLIFRSNRLVQSHDVPLKLSRKQRWFVKIGFCNLLSWFVHYVLLLPFWHFQRRGRTCFMREYFKLFFMLAIISIHVQNKTLEKLFRDSFVFFMAFVVQLVAPENDGIWKAFFKDTMTKVRISFHVAAATDAVLKMVRGSIGTRKSS